MTKSKKDIFLEQKKKIKVKTNYMASSSHKVIIDFNNKHTPSFSFDAFENEQKDILDFAKLPVEVGFDEANQLILDIKKYWDEKKLNSLIEQCRTNMISSIVGPFGLGKVVAAYDKTGGNVTTIHNANQNIYAKEEDKYRREDYDSSENSEGGKFKKSGQRTDKNGKVHKYDKGIGSDFMKKTLIQGEKNKIRDAYTGKIENSQDTSPDHIVSLKQYHKEGGFMQSKRQKADFATDTDNFAPTKRSINQSLRDHDKQEWAEKKREGSKTNAEHYGVNKERLNNAVERGQETANNHLPSKKVYYAGKIGLTGLNEAGKMGFQQSIGLLLSEFLEGIFFEIQDSYKNGFTAGVDEIGFLKALKKRLSRIAKKVLMNWKKVVEAFRDGAISGFISNLLTSIINMFITTAKRVVRMIREGIFSLIKAVKLILFRPEGMTIQEASDAALKLIATGVLTGLGIVAEDFLSKALEPYLTAIPFVGAMSSQIVQVVTGALVGISTALTVFMIDKLDLFGVRRKQEHELTIKELDEQIAKYDERINRMYDLAMNPFY